MNRQIFEIETENYIRRYYQTQKQYRVTVLDKETGNIQDKRVSMAEFTSAIEEYHNA